MSKGRPKTKPAVKKEETKATVSASQITNIELISQKPSIIPIQKVEVKFNIFGESEVVYFELDDEKATLSNEDRSKIISAVSSVLKGVDGKNYIFNKSSAESAFKQLKEKESELKRIENKIKLESKFRDENREKLEKIPKLLRNFFGA